MKILHISESISTLSGGLQSTVFGFATALSNNNENIILSAKDSGNVDIENIEIVFTEKIGFWKINFFKNFKKIIEEINPDLIIQHGIWSPFVIQVTKFCKENNKPYVIVTHGMLDPYITNKNKWQKYLSILLYQKKNLNNAVFIRALNDNEKNHIKVITDKDVFISPNGLLNPPSSFDNLKIKNKVVYLGRIDHKKGVLELIEGWILLEKKGVLPLGATLEIAGWSSSKEYGSAVAGKVRESNTIKMVGSLFGMDKWNFLNSAEAFILPSRGEGLPTVILEAWYANCISIITDDCNFSQMQMKNCAIKTEVNPCVIANSLEYFFRLSEFDKKKITKNAFEELNLYNWNSIADDFMSYVHEKI